MSETLDDAEAVSAAERKKREAKRKRKKEERKAKKAKKKRRRIELGPPPETKIDLSKLEQDIIQLAEDAASSGKIIMFLVPNNIHCKTSPKDRS